MEIDPHDVNQAVTRMAFAQSSIMRGLLRHLVEENYIEPAKAAKIILDAVALDYPPEDSTGYSYNLARETLTDLASALLAWPGSDDAKARRGPKQDLR